MTTEVITREQAEGFLSSMPEAFIIEDYADQMVVSSAPDQEEAVRFAQELRGEIASARQWFEPILAPLREAKRAADERKRAVVRPREAAIQVIQKKITQYRHAVQEEANQKEAEERARLQAAAELARTAALKAAEEAGEVDRAAAIERNINAPVAVAPIAVAEVEREAPKLKGMAESRTWKARFRGGVNEAEAKRELCAAIGAGAQGPGFVNVDWPMLNRLAGATEGVATVPGIEFYEDVQTIVRKG